MKLFVVISMALAIVNCLPIEDSENHEPKHWDKELENDQSYELHENQQYDHTIDEYPEHQHQNSVHEGSESEKHVKHIVTKLIPVPYPVEVKKPVALHVKVPYPVQTEKKIPIVVEKKYPVYVEKKFPVHVDRPVPYPMKVEVPVHQKEYVDVPKPYKVYVEKPYPVYVNYPVYIEKPVPFTLLIKKQEKKPFWQLG